MMGARLLSEPVDARELVAPTRWGNLRVSMPWGGLSDVDGLVRQLTHWCQHPLVFEVMSEAASLGDELTESEQVRCVISDMRLAPIGTEVFLPLALVLESVPPAALQGAAVNWPQWHFEVTVGSLPESAIESAHVQEGGQILLPNAFQQPWLVRLQAEEVPFGLVGHLRLNAGMIDLLQRADDAANDAQHELLDVDAWQVQLARAVVLDLPVALGWVPGAHAVPVDYTCHEDDDTEFGLGAHLNHEARGLTLVGMVVPVMPGAALRIRAVRTVL